ncbi:hypothetical protein HHK36_000840 [Tetracentron sinense]|uniref:Uncharacterized protein n=1 Tax=Tetracentron sinense TaxID=13715 RepID=A0A834ZX32_TETSI|nr:hypothetical protein HHK36_000840 [Tetracentron sinense]
MDDDFEFADKVLMPLNAWSASKELLGFCNMFNFVDKNFSNLGPLVRDVIAHVVEDEADDINRAISTTRKAFDEGPRPKNELDEMKKQLKEMEEEAAALREMQAKVEKEMGTVQGFWIFYAVSCYPLLYVEFQTFLLRDVYDDMLLDGIQPSRDIFHSLIVGTMKGAHLQDAFFFKDEMKAMGMAPDVSSII